MPGCLGELSHHVVKGPPCGPWAHRCRTMSTACSDRSTAPCICQAGKVFRTWPSKTTVRSSARPSPESVLNVPGRVGSAHSQVKSAPAAGGRSYTRSVIVLAAHIVWQPTKVCWCSSLLYNSSLVRRHGRCPYVQNVARRWPVRNSLEWVCKWHRNGARSLRLKQRVAFGPKACSVETSDSLLATALRTGKLSSFILARRPARAV